MVSQPENLEVIERGGSHSMDVTFLNRALTDGGIPTNPDGYTPPADPTAYVTAEIKIYDVGTGSLSTPPGGYNEPTLSAVTYGGSTGKFLTTLSASGTTALSSTLALSNEKWAILWTTTINGIAFSDFEFLTVAPTGALDFGGTSLYCTVDDVKRFLFRNVQGFDANTFLTSEDVEEIIQTAMSRIDDYTQRSWTGQTHTETIDVTYSDKWRWHGDYIVHGQVTYRPIRAVQSIHVYQGGDEIEIAGPTEGTTEDRTTTWYKVDALGSIYLVGSDIPSILRNGIKITYTWGDTTVPHSVKGACYRFAAAEIMESENYAVELPEESDTAGSVADKVNRWTNDAYDLIDRQRDILYSAGGG